MMEWSVPSGLVLEAEWSSRRARRAAGTRKATVTSSARAQVVGALPSRSPLVGAVRAICRGSAVVDVIDDIFVGADLVFAAGFVRAGAEEGHEQEAGGEQPAHDRQFASLS